MNQIFSAADISIIGGADGITNIYVFSENKKFVIIFLSILIAAFLFFSLCFFCKRKKNYLKNGIIKKFLAPSICFVFSTQVFLFFTFVFFHNIFIFVMIFIWVLFMALLIINVVYQNKFYSNIKNIIDELNYNGIYKELCDELFLGFIKYGNTFPRDFPKKIRPYYKAINKFSKINFSDELIELNRIQLLLRKSQSLSIFILSLCATWFIFPVLLILFYLLFYFL